MTECDRLRPALVRMVEGDAGPEEALEVGKHLSDCTVCRIVLARQRRIAEMVSDLGEPIEVDESFLRQVMDSLPDGPPPRIDVAGRRAKAWKGLKLASLLLVTLLFVPGPGDVTAMLSGVGELPRVVPLAQPESFGGLPGPMEGLSGILVAALTRVGVGTGLETPGLPVVAGFVAALLAFAASGLLVLSAGVGVAARAVGRSFN